MTAHDELRNDVAEAAREALLDALRRLNPDAGDEGDDEFTDDEYDALVSAVVQGLAKGAYQRAVDAADRQGYGLTRKELSLVIAATLGLDPTEVPT